MLCFKSTDTRAYSQHKNHILKLQSANYLEERINLGDKLCARCETA